MILMEKRISRDGLDHILDAAKTQELLEAVGEFAKMRPNSQKRAFWRATRRAPHAIGRALAELILHGRGKPTRGPAAAVSYSAADSVS